MHYNSSFILDFHYSSLSSSSSSLPPSLPLSLPLFLPLFLLIPGLFSSLCYLNDDGVTFNKMHKRLMNHILVVRTKIAIIISPKKRHCMMRCLLLYNWLPHRAASFKEYNLHFNSYEAVVGIIDPLTDHLQPVLYVNLNIIQIISRERGGGGEGGRETEREGERQRERERGRETKGETIGGGQKRQYI